MLLAENNPYVSGETSVFEKLVGVGEDKSFITLPFQLRVFLVNCLVEHLRDREITHLVLALNFLRFVEKSGEQANRRLKRTGDAALILAGLFPERALRLRVSSCYFRLMGQAAYASLGATYQATGKPERGKLYYRLAEHFQLLEKVLNAARARPETEWDAYIRFRVRLQ